MPINYINHKEPLELTRANSYIGTLIDDLVTKDLDEPYRMLTSRSEYRLILRQDNADERLMEIGFKAGLVDEERISRFRQKQKEIEIEIENLKNTKISPTKENKEILAKYSEPLDVGKSAFELLKRPNVDYNVLKELGYKSNSEYPDKFFEREVKEQAEIKIKYDGYIKRQNSQIESADKMERINIPQDIDYFAIKQISTETKEKLDKIRPKTLAQALRIGGVKPADISCLMVLLESRKLKN